MHTNPFPSIFGKYFEMDDRPLRCCVFHYELQIDGETKIKFVNRSAILFALYYGKCGLSNWLSEFKNKYKQFSSFNSCSLKSKDLYSYEISDFQPWGKVTL